MSHLLQTVACPECGKDFTMSLNIQSREDGTDDDGKRILYLSFTDFEILAGCEHAELARDEITIRTEMA